MSKIKERTLEKTFLFYSTRWGQTSFFFFFFLDLFLVLKSFHWKLNWCSLIQCESKLDRRIIASRIYFRTNINKIKKKHRASELWQETIQTRSMFKIKVDKQTVTDARQPKKCLLDQLRRNTWRRVVLEVQLLSLFMRFQCRSPCCCHSQAKGSSSARACYSLYTTLKCLRLPPQLKSSLQVAHCTLAPSTQGPVLEVTITEATVKPEWCSRLRDYKINMTRVIQQNLTLFLLYW